MDSALPGAPHASQVQPSRDAVCLHLRQAVQIRRMVAWAAAARTRLVVVHHCTLHLVLSKGLGMDGMDGSWRPGGSSGPGAGTAPPGLAGWTTWAALAVELQWTPHSSSGQPCCWIVPVLALGCACGCNWRANKVGWILELRYFH